MSRSPQEVEILRPNELPILKPSLEGKTHSLSVLFYKIQYFTSKIPDTGHVWVFPTPKNSPIFCKYVSPIFCKHVSYNSIQFWYHLPGVRIGPHRLRAQSHKLPPAISDANHKSRCHLSLSGPFWVPPFHCPAECLGLVAKNAWKSCNTFPPFMKKNIMENI